MGEGDVLAVAELNGVNPLDSLIVIHLLRFRPSRQETLAPAMRMRHQTTAHEHTAENQQSPAPHPQRTQPRLEQHRTNDERRPNEENTHLCRVIQNQAVHSSETPKQIETTANPSAAANTNHFRCGETAVTIWSVVFWLRLTSTRFPSTRMPVLFDFSSAIFRNPLKSLSLLSVGGIYQTNLNCQQVRRSPQTDPRPGSPAPPASCC